MEDLEDEEQERFFCQDCDQLIAGISEKTHYRRLHQHSVRVTLTAHGTVFPNGRTTMIVERAEEVLVLIDNLGKFSI